MQSSVDSHGRKLRERFATVFALVWLFSSMASSVHGEVALGRETLAANIANAGFLPSVRFCMVIHGSFRSKALAAEFADKCMSTLMLKNMRLQPMLTWETFPAQITDMTFLWLVTGHVSLEVNRQIALTGQNFATSRTWVYFPTVAVFIPHVVFQLVVGQKTLMAHNTRKRKLLVVFSNMPVHVSHAVAGVWTTWTLYVLSISMVLYVIFQLVPLQKTLFANIAHVLLGQVPMASFDMLSVLRSRLELFIAHTTDENFMSTPVDFQLGGSGKTFAA